MLTTMIDDGVFRSRLEIPDGRDPNQNAWLTITLRYSLNFADRRNLVPGVIVQKAGNTLAVDSDKKELPIRDWDLDAILKFQRMFARGETIWNQQFLLITPKDYAVLDYDSMAGAGWKVRPNVLCLFRLVPNFATAHLRITVVRVDESKAHPASFRSNKSLYEYLDVWSPTLGHELGHALGQGHIKELLNDGPCIADAKRGVFPHRCYGETAVEKANIMGSGTAKYLLNAKPWLDRIADHSDRPRTDWTVTGVVSTPPRKIPLGVMLVGPPSTF